MSKSKTAELKQSEGLAAEFIDSIVGSGAAPHVACHALTKALMRILTGQGLTAEEAALKIRAAADEILRSAGENGALQ